MFNILGDNMAKEKKSEIDNKTKEFTFFYEIIGIICILISLISIARLGIIGFYGMLVFRLLFGDWYFLFLIALGALGVFFLFVHHSFSLKNIRYLGILLIILSLITLTHFSMHNYVSKLEGNKLKNTFLLYIDYFKNGRSSMMIGGGIIGCCLFYLLYYLFSSVGITIICLIAIFIGIVFISKLTVVDFISIVGGWFKKTFGKAAKLPHKMKGIFGKYSNDYKKIKANPIYNQKYLNNNNFIFQDLEKQNKQCIEYVTQIKKTLDHLNIFYQDVTFMVCNHISIFFIVTMQKINYDIFRISLQKFINNSFLIRYDLQHQTTIIEVNNTISHSLSMKEAIQKEYNGIVIGKDDRNEIVNTKENILVIGNNSLQFRYYFSSLILYPRFLETTLNDTYILIDLNENLLMLKNCVNTYTNDIEYLNNLKIELDNIIKLINEDNASTIKEYNQKHKNKLKKTYVFISGVQKVITNKEFSKILEYLLITGSEIGYQFVIGLTSDCQFEIDLLRQFNYKIILYNNFGLSSKLLGFGLIDSIKKETEGFLKYQDLTIRLSLLMLKKEELDKIRKRYG